MTMLLVLQLLGLPLLLANVNLVNAQCQECQNHIFGERTLYWGHSLRQNLVHMLGFLEERRLPGIDPEFYTYLSNLRHGLISNVVDVFGMFTSVIPIYQQSLPYERVQFILEELERLSYKQGCIARCTILKWWGNQQVQDLFNQVPKNLIFHNLPNTYEGLIEIADVGAKIAAVDCRTAELEGNKNFGKSISKILREIQQVKYCFNERFFGYLLSFYPWPNDDLPTHLAVQNLQYHLIHDQNLFIACNIRLNVLYSITNEPWALLDYLLIEMDASRCVFQLEYDIKRLIEAERRLIFAEPLTNFADESLINLLEVITPDIYPAQIVLARDRVYRYLLKLLPLLDQSNFVQHFYNTPEEKLLFLLDYILKIDPYPIKEVLDAIKAIQGHLYFQTGPKVISVELLNYILNAWSAPDLLDYVKAQVQEIRAVVEEKAPAINGALLNVNNKRCFGITQCYTKIALILKSLICFDKIVTDFKSPSCLLATPNVCSGNNTSLGLLTFQDIVPSINHYRYSHRTVQAAQNILNYIQNSRLAVTIGVPPGVCTSDEAIVNTLESFVKDGSMFPIQNDFIQIIAEDKNKLAALQSKPEPQTPTLGLDMDAITLTDFIINAHKGQGVQLAPEMISTLTYLRERNQIVTKILREARCHTRTLPQCFNIAREMFHENQLFKRLAPALRYALNPTYCDNQGCHWIPYEEQECGLLNPTLAYLTHLLQSFRKSIKHFQLELDAQGLLQIVKTEYICAALSTCPIRLGVSSKEMFLVLLQCLQQGYLNEGAQIAVGNIVNYVSSGKVPTTLSVDNINSLTKTLLNGASDVTRSQKILEVMQIFHKMKSEVQWQLRQMNIDCKTLESCMYTIASESSLTPNKIISLPTTCNYFNASSGTSFIPQLHCNTMNMSPKTLTINGVLTTLAILKEDCRNLSMQLKQEISNATQQLHHYIANMPSQILTAKDLVNMLVILKKDYPNVNTQLKEKIDNILTHIWTHKDKWTDFLLTLPVDCSNLENCLNNLKESLSFSINQVPTQIKVDLQNLLNQVIESATTSLPNWQLSESGTDDMRQSHHNIINMPPNTLTVNDLANMLTILKEDSPNVNTQLKEEIEKLLTNIETNNGQWTDLLATLPVDCSNLQNCLNNLKESLSVAINEAPSQTKVDLQNLLNQVIESATAGLPNWQLSENGTDDMQQSHHNIIHMPSNTLTVNDLANMLTILKEDSPNVNTQLKEEIEKLLTNIETNTGQWTDLLATLPVDCSNLQNCLNNLKESLSVAINEAPSQTKVDLHNLLNQVIESATAGLPNWQLSESGTDDMQQSHHNIIHMPSNTLTVNDLANMLTILKEDSPNVNTQLKEEIEKLLTNIETNNGQWTDLLATLPVDCSNLQNCLNNLKESLSVAINEAPSQIKVDLQNLLNQVIEPTATDSIYAQVFESGSSLTQQLHHNIINMPSNTLTLNDLANMLTILKEDSPNVSTQLKEEIEKLLTNIETNNGQWTDLLATLSVDCSNLQNCLNNLKESLSVAINEAPSQTKVDLQNLLNQVIESATAGLPNWQLSESGTYDMQQSHHNIIHMPSNTLTVNDLANMLTILKEDSPNVNTQLKEEIEKLLTNIETNNGQWTDLLATLPVDCSNLQNCLNNLKESLSVAINEAPSQIKVDLQNLLNQVIEPTATDSIYAQVFESGSSLTQQLHHNIINMPSNTLTLNDLAQMLTILKEDSPNVNTQLKEEIKKLLTNIETNNGQWTDLLATLPVDCSNLQNCLNNLKESLSVAINEAPSQTKVDLQNLLNQVIESATAGLPNWQLSESGTDDMQQSHHNIIHMPSNTLTVNDLANMLTILKEDSPNVNTQLKEEIEKLLTNIETNNGQWTDLLATLPVDCSNLQNCLNNLKESLSVAINEAPSQVKVDLQSLLNQVIEPTTSSLLIAQLLESGSSLVRQVHHNITNMSPNALAVNDLARMLTILKQEYSTVNTHLREKIDNILTHIWTHNDQWTDFLSTHSVDCSTLRNCLNSLRGVAISQVPRQIREDLQDMLIQVAVPSTLQNITEIKNDIINNIYTMIQSGNTSQSRQLDLMRIIQLIKNEDVSPIIWDVLHSNPANVLVEFLLKLPKDMMEKYGITHNIQKVINSIITTQPKIGVFGNTGSVLRPFHCTNNSCDWIDTPQWNRTMNNGLNNLKHVLMDYLLREDTPPPVKIALDYLIRQLHKPELQDLVEPTASLPDVLMKIVNNKKVDVNLRNKAAALLAYLNNQILPTPGLANCADMHALALILIQNTRDAVIREEIMMLNNKLSRLEHQCDQQLKDCPVECRDQQSCAKELQNCAEQTRSCVAWDMSEIFLPPSCTKQVCGQAGEGVEILDSAPDFLIVLIEVSQADVRTIQLDLKDPLVANTLWKLSHISASPSKQVVIRLQVSTGNSIHVAIDLTNPLVRGQLLGLERRDMEAAIDCSSMGVVSLVWVPLIGPAKWLTFDLKNPSLRQTLRQLMQGQVQGTRPFVIVRRCDTPTYLLHVDFRDTLHYQQLLKVSIEGLRIINNMTLLFFPGKTDHWQSVDVNNLTISALAKIQSLPRSEIIGAVNAFVLSSIGLIRFSFDVYNPSVSQELIALSKARAPVVDVDSTSTLGLMFPDKHARLKVIYLHLTPETISRLKMLSEPAHPSVTPTLVLRSDKQIVPLWLNLDNQGVSEYLNRSCLSSSRIKVVQETTTATDIWLSLDKKAHILSSLITDKLKEKNLPCFVELELAALNDLLSNTHVLQRLQHLLKSLPFDRKLNFNDIVTKILQHLPLDFIKKYQLESTVNNIVQYFLGGIVPNKLNIHTIHQLGKILAVNTTDANVAAWIRQQLNALTWMNDTNGVLSRMTMACGNLRQMVASLNSAIRQSHKNEVTQILSNLLNPPPCTIQTCSWISNSARFQNQLMDLYDVFVKQLEILSMKPDLPLHIKLDTEVLLDVLKSDEAKRRLEGFLQELPENKLADMLSELKLSVTAPLSPVKVIPTFIKQLPNKFFDVLNRSENAQNIYNYLTRGTIPTVLNANSLRKLFQETLKVIGGWEAQPIVQQLDQLSKLPEINDILIKHPVKCYNLRLCLETLSLVYAQAPVLDKTTSILSNLVHNTLEILDSKTPPARQDIPFPLAVFPLLGCNDYAVLDLRNIHVVRLLIKLSEVTNPAYPDVVFAVVDSYRRVKHTIKLKLNDQFTARILLQLERDTLSLFTPVRVQNKFGSALVAVLKNPSGRRQSYTICDNQKNYNYFKSIQTNSRDGVTFPFTQGAVQVSVLPDYRAVKEKCCFLYFPRGLDVQPDYMPLPDNVRVGLNWDKVLHMKNSQTGTVLPFILPDGQVGYVTLDMSNGKTLKGLLEQSLGNTIGVPDSSMCVLSVLDEKGVPTPIVLDLRNPYVRDQLKLLSEGANQTSDNLAAITIMDENGKSHYLLFDMDHLDVKQIQQLGQLTSPDLDTFYIKDKATDAMGAVITIKDQNGRISPLILNLNNLQVVEVLKSLSDFRNRRGNRVYVKDSSGRIIELYLDKSNPSVVDKLIQLSQLTKPIPKPLLNVDKDRLGEYYITVPQANNGKTVFAMNPKNARAFQALLELSKLAHANTPYVFVRAPDGATHYLRLDTNNAKVYDTLKQFADKITTEKPLGCLMVVQPPGEAPIILDTCNCVVVKALENVSLSSQYLPTQNVPGLDILTVEDAFGNYHDILLNLSDANTINVLKDLQRDTPLNMNPIEIPQSNGASSAVLVIGDDENKKGIIIEGSNPEILKELQTHSNMFDRKATKVTVTDGKSMIVHLYLDLNDANIRELLQSLQTDGSSLPSLNLADYGDTDVTIPVYYQNGRQTMFKCNLSDFGVRKVMKDLNNVLGPRPITWNLFARDLDRQITTLDVANPIVVSKLATVCTEPPRPEDLLLITAKNNEGVTYSYVLNPKNPTVSEQLSKLSDSTSHLPNAKPTKFQITDNEGNPVNIYLDLTNPNVLAELQRLSDISAAEFKSVLVLPDENGDKTLVVIKVTNADGKPYTIVLDSKEGEVVNVLSGVSDQNNTDAVPVEITSKGNSMVFYIDKKNPKIVSRLILLSRRRRIRKPILIKPSYVHTDVIALPFSLKNEKLTLLIDLRNPIVKKVIKEISTIPSPNTATVYVRESDGTVQPYYLNTADEDTARKLIEVSIKYEYTMKDDTLLIVPVTLENGVNQYVILDLTNDNVTETLHHISKNMGKEQDKVLFQHTDSLTGTALYKLDLNDVHVVKKVCELQELTVPWIKPQLVVSPYSPRPLIIATIPDIRGQVRPIVLPTDNLDALSALISLQTPYPRRDLHIQWPTGGNAYRDIHLDVANPNVVKTLIALSSPQNDYPREIITNRRIRECHTSLKFTIPVETDLGLVLYSLDTTNIDTFNGISSLASPPDIPSSVVTMCNPKGEITAMRINTRDKEVVSKLEFLSNDKRVQANPVNLIVFTIPLKRGGAMPIILDISNEEVVSELQDLPQINEDKSNAIKMLISLKTLNNQLLPVTFDINQPKILLTLRKLQQKTPKNILPVLIPSSAGPQPLMLCTLEGERRDTIPVLLDLNNPNVVQELSQHSRPNDPYAIPINVLNYNKKIRTIYINIKEYETKSKLLALARLCPIFAGPIAVLNPNDNMVIPVEEAHGKVLEVVLDITDGDAMAVLRRLKSKYGNLVVNVPNEYGVLEAVLIDNRNPVIIGILKDLGRKFLALYNSKIIPPSGPLALATFCPVLSNDRFMPITVDPNDQAVIEFLNTQMRHAQGQTGFVRFKLPLNTDYPMIGNIPNSPQTYEGMRSVSQKLQILVVPMDVILPQKKIPLLCFLIQDIRAIFAITLDLEDETILDELRYYEIDEGAETFTVLFDTPQEGKVPVSLNIRDQSLVNKLKGFAARLPVTIVPVLGKHPMIAITLQSREDIVLDLNDDVVVRGLLSISNSQAKEIYPKTEIKLTTPDGFRFAIRIAFDNPYIQDQLKKLSQRTPVPPVFTTMPALPGVKPMESPVRILPPGHTLYPLITIQTDATGQITVDPNNYQVRTQLRMWSLEKHRLETSLKIEMTDVIGDIVMYNLDLSAVKVVEALKIMRKRCPVQVLFKGPVGALPELVIRHPYKQQQKKKEPLHVDLQRPEVLKAFIHLGTNYNYRNPYRIQIQTPQGSVLCLIDFGDPNVVRAIEAFSLDNRKEPHYASFEVPDNMGNIWTIVLDMANDRVLSELLERSNKTSASTANVIQLPLPNGKTVNVRLNLYDVNTLNLLKQLSQKSTNLPPKMVPQKPKRLLEINIKLPTGLSKYRIDVNNDSVMKKFKRLSAMHAPGSGVIINVPRPDGSNDRMRFDFNNPIVVKNLYNLQIESLTGKISPLIPITDEDGGSKFKQKMFIALNITSPHYGDLKIAIDLYLPGMMDKLQALADSFVAGRPETQVPVDDQRGRSLLLRLDVTNPKTIEALARLTEESVGKNPLAGRRLPSASEVLTAELLTIEIPVGVEVLPITLDISNSDVAHALARLDMHKSGPTLTTIDIKTATIQSKISLNTSDVQALSDLLTVSTPTAFPMQALKVSLITLIFVNRGDGRLLPIEVDLAERRNVLRLVGISQASQAYMRTPTFMEVRDDTGQYVRVPLDLNNHTVVNTLINEYFTKTKLKIDASTMPYLTLVTPTGSNGPHSVIKFQTKPKVIRRLVKELAAFNAGVPVEMTDFFHETHRFNLDVTVPGFPNILRQLETVTVINPPRVTNLFVVYVNRDNGDVDPIYLNMHIPRTVEAVKISKYLSDMPLTLIQYRDKAGQYQYDFLDLTNTDNIDQLMESSYAVGGHSIVKQIRTQKIMLTVSKAQQEVTIALDLSNPNVLRGIEDITKSANSAITMNVVEMEDPYGFPVVLRFNPDDAAMVDRLIALSS